MGLTLIVFILYIYIYIRIFFLYTIVILYFVCALCVFSLNVMRSRKCARIIVFHFNSLMNLRMQMSDLNHSSSFFPLLFFLFIG